ncbi:MAG: leucyl aminopeptidase [Holosporales bacterium]|jgi:leucyl aminopeptidase|nr:leucyl aminopeptidase [Holosporales bacterium]
MSVTFLESIEPGNVGSVVVLVAFENDKSFIAEKLEELLPCRIPDTVALLLDDLGYNKISSFSLILDGSLREIIIVGAGSMKFSTRASLEKLGGYICDNIKTNEAKVTIFSNIESDDLKTASAYITSGMQLKAWVFDKYKAKKQEPKVVAISCQTRYQDANKKEFDCLSAVNEGVCTVRRMSTEPANVMTPDQMVEEAKDLKHYGVKVSVLDKKDMEKIGMNALLGVGQGSENPSYLITMEYMEGDKSDLIALVGKGLTFDSGGISIKPANKMGEMKEDMTGAAVVIGAIKALASQKVKANVVGVIGVVENMVSGKAQRPGDVVVAMSKKTIEVDNTDAEGRLVLADALWYTKEKFSPKIIIDFATLTGAIQVALGHEFAGLFSNSDDLCARLFDSSDTVGEKLWRFPLHHSYEDDIKSCIADIKNVGSGRGAGSITAALFLKHFVDPDVKWAHIDIAAVAADSKNRALSQRGATGFGVRLIDNFVKNYKEIV